MQYQLKPIIKIGSYKDILDTNNNSQNVLVLTTKSINYIHKIDKFFHNKKFQVISNVLPELPLTYVKKLYSEIKFVPDLIIAIGGGSVLDLGKALSVAKNFSVLEKLYSKNLIDYEKHAQLFAAPTTFGTGAETSFGSILYNDTIKKKDALRSKILQSDMVVIDQNLYSTASPKIMAESGFDCLTHAIETYLSKATNEIVKFQSVAAINIVFDHLENAVKHQNKKSITKMAIASMMMGVNLAYSSTCLPHRIQYVIGPITNTSHAQGLVMIYKGWLKLINKQLKNNNEIKSLLCDLKLTFKEFENKILLLRTRLGIDYSLNDFNINNQDLDNISNLVSGNLTNDPFFKDIDSIKFILKESMN
jgi:alcohol dehydrogenase class IV